MAVRHIRVVVPVRPGECKLARVRKALVERFESTDMNIAEGAQLDIEVACDDPQEAAAARETVAELVHGAVS